MWLLSFGLAMSVAGCVNGKLSPVVAPIVDGIDTASCKIVEVLDPADATYIGSVCDVALPTVNGILSGISSAEHAAWKGAGSFRLTTIDDGAHQQGVVCAWMCGDMTKASAADPCPVVDATLRAAKAKGARR